MWENEWSQKSCHSCGFDFEGRGWGGERSQRSCQMGGFDFEEKIREIERCQILTHCVFPIFFADSGPQFQLEF